MRKLSRADEAIAAFQQRLGIVSGLGPPARREYPSTITEVPSAPRERRHSTGLMRVNHVGEICAQALYDGQAATARSQRVRAVMRHAATEELDHLDWTRRRIAELGGETSRLGGLFYATSFAAGAIAGALGDRINLGFLAATEEEVSAHLDRHLASLPESDRASASVVKQMRNDEARHAQTARRAGGLEFSVLTRRLMRSGSRIMTTLTYRF